MLLLLHWYEYNAKTKAENSSTSVNWKMQFKCTLHFNWKEHTKTEEVVVHERKLKLKIFFVILKYRFSFNRYRYNVNKYCDNHGTYSGDHLRPPGTHYFDVMDWVCLVCMLNREHTGSGEKSCLCLSSVFPNRPQVRQHLPGHSSCPTAGRGSQNRRGDRGKHYIAVSMDDFMCPSVKPVGISKACSPVVDVFSNRRFIV